MSDRFLHQHSEFGDLIRIVAAKRAIDPALVEKDYWIMQGLFGLQSNGLAFELKGGTSLSKGFGLIERFSEDLDIRIDPPVQLEVKTGRHSLEEATRQKGQALSGSGELDNVLDPNVSRDRPSEGDADIPVMYQGRRLN